MKLFYIFTTLLGYLLSSTLTFADTKITYKSAKSTSSYYQMGVQIAEAMKKKLKWFNYCHRRREPRFCTKC